MHPELERQMAAQRVDGLRRDAASARLAKAVAEGDVVIRAARRDDAAVVAALAELDEKLPPVGGALVAEVCGTIRAALPLGGGVAIADPFRRTEHLVALLEARAEQLERARRAKRRQRLGRHAPSLLRRLV
jgi:hypothetical protein